MHLGEVPRSGPPPLTRLGQDTSSSPPPLFGWTPEKKKKPLCSAQLTHVVTAVALLFVTVCRWLSAPRNGKSRECGGCPLVVVPLPLCRLFVSVFSKLFFPAGGIYFVLVTRCRSILICPRVQFSICPIGLHVQRRKEFQKFTPICLKCER